jgi:hypothetical protein
MNMKIDEVLHAYAQILSDLPEQSTPEPLWHATVDFPDTIPDLDVATVSLETNAFVSTAADKQEVELLKEKLHPVKIEDVIELAHPEPVYIADAMGDGGLVENQNELHKKIVEMINKYPSGTAVHKYAALVEDLLSVASHLDADGHSSAANELDSLASDIASVIKKKNSELTKSAFLFAIPAVVKGVAAILSATGAAWYAYKGKQDNLAADLKKLGDNVDSWKDDSTFAAFKTRIYKLRDAITSMQGATSKWISDSNAYASHKSPLALKDLHDSTEELKNTFDAYKPIRDEVIESKLSGGWFPLFKLYESNVMSGYKDLMNYAASQEAGATRAKQDQDPFESKEMLDAPGVEEPATSSNADSTPLDKSLTTQAQLFINQAYEPIGPAHGIIDDVWYRGIKGMVDSLRSRLQRASAVQDPNTAAETAMQLNISRFVKMNNDGSYSLLVSASDINKIINLTELVESQAQAIRAQPHESLLK